MTDYSNDPLAAEEQRKYTKMWNQASYRINSPGFNWAPRSLALLNPPPGATIIDYGCGVPRAVDFFRSKGLEATGCDIVALREDVRPVNLWDLPSDLGSDYAYCADVMEHIPPEKVLAVLGGIAERTKVAAAFTIASTQCTQGRRHGEVLHLTVEPKDWWMEQLQHFWKHISHYKTDRGWRHLFITSGPIYSVGGD